jgi:uncharacterized membrane protein HdeD (DUF308 family)
MESGKMTEEKQETRSPSRLESSKFLKAFMVVLAAFLIFAGPTYVVYLFQHGFDLDYGISMGSGIVLFIIGLALLLYLIRNRTIS